MTARAGSDLDRDLAAGGADARSRTVDECGGRPPRSSRSLGVSLRFALVGVALISAGVLAEFSAREPADAVRAAPAPPLHVTTVLPAWRAPGGRFVVSGFAGRDDLVRLLVDGRRIATTHAGPRGRFVLRGAVAAVGRHRIVVARGADISAVGAMRVRPIVLAAVGDVTPGEDVGPAVASRGAAYRWTAVGHTLAAADVTTANLEGAVSDRGTPAGDKQYHFRGPDELLHGAATFAGMDVVTLANNHSMDFGADALEDTIASARRAGIRTIGAGMNQRLARAPAILDVGGLKLAFLGYSDANPYGFTATTTTPGTAAADSADIAADVKAARRRPMS